MITCPINDPEIVSLLYKLIVIKLNNFSSNETFDHEAFLKELYDEIADKTSPEVAAKYLQSVPRLLSLAAIKRFENIDIDTTALNKLSRKFKSETGIAEIIQTYSTDSDEELRRKIKEKEDAENKIPVESTSDQPVILLPTRFKAASAASGTLQQFVKVDPKKKGQHDEVIIETIDPELETTINVTNKINDLQNTTLPGEELKYQGKTLRLKVQDVVGFRKEYSDKLRKNDEESLKRSSAILAQGSKLGDVIPINAQSLLVITDDNGNFLYFDKDGNITDEANGNIVYQFLRPVRKDGKEYTVTNVYTTESSVATPEQIAQQTYDQNSDIDYDAYVKAIKQQQQEEFKALYGIQEQIKSGDKTSILLPITGVSSGVPSNLSSTIIYLNELSKFPGLDIASILTSINVITSDTASFKKGQTTVRINGGEFKINNPRMNEELMSEIAAMLMDPNPPASLKQIYLNQFIDTTKDTTRRIQFNSIDNTIELYKKTSTKNSSGTYTFGKVINRTIDLEKLKNNGYTEQERQDLEKDILQYLREGFKNGPTLININSSLIKNQKEFIRYNRDTKEPYSGDYLEFISSFPAEINLINADPGIYNRSIEFAFPGSFIDDLQKADKNLNNTEGENLSFEEILKRKEEEDNRNPVKVEARDIIANSKSEEFLNKVKNYPGNTNINPTDNFLLVAYFKAAIKEKNYTKEFANSIKNEIQSLLPLNPLSVEQVKMIEDEIDAIKEVPSPSQTQAEIKDQVEVPGAPDPINNATTNGMFTDNDIDDDIFKGLFRRGSKDEKIAREKVIAARTWWNSPELAPLRKVISLEHVANLVNSDVYASFITNASKIANPDGTLGKITANTAKGSVFQNLTIYHEAWHGFSQLFLSKQDKIDLYEELRNYTTPKGATPYATKSYLELEEMLAEDFRNYVKTGKAKASSPKRNTLFRRMVEFLKQLFGKGLKKFNNKDVLINSLNSPMAKELFDKLYIGDINKYTPLIDNSMFYSLDRGVPSVNNKRNVVLSKQDSTLAVSSIDGIFSQILNTINEKARVAGKSGAKGANIAVFLEPSRRAALYVQAKKELESKLKIEKDKLAKVEGIVNFSTLTTLQEIKDNAAGVFVNSEGKNKFIFLKSQIDDFTILEPSLKANGDRVKGEKYHGIKIVSDFYKHKTILNGKVPADIMVVTSMAQAEEQLKNYIDGNSKAYTKVIDNKLENPVLLTEDQEFIQDNIRILQTMLDNYGDENSGLVKYHMENSDFEISKTKYELDVIDENNDEAISENDLENSGRDIETFNDVKKHKQSLLQTMSKETTMLLKSLIKTDGNNVVKNRLGFPERVDFIKVFNIVAKTIGGVRDRELAYNLLKAEASKFPEIQQLIDFKYPDPNTKNSYEFDISRQFLQDFGKPKVTYKIVLAVPDEESGTIDFKLAEASLAISNITGRWQTEFVSASPSRYIKKTPDNESELNLQNILTDFSKKDELVISKAFDFAKAIGINLTVNDNIKSDFDSKLEYYGIPFMFNIVKDFAQIEQDLNNPATAASVSSAQKTFLNKFKANPIEVLRTAVPINILTTFPKGINENTQITRLAELQAKYGYDSATTGVITADGNTAYEDVNYSFMTGFVDAVNSVSNIRDLWTKNEYSHMAYLNPNTNTFTKNLRILNEIFDMHTGAKKPGKSLQLMNVNGTSQITEDENGNSNTEGTVTADLDPIGKGLQELHSMLGGGVSEFNRMSEKKNAYGLKVVGGIVGKTDPISYATKGADTDLYVDVIQFANNGNGEIYAINNHFLGYIQSEFDRIVKFKGNRREEYLNFTGFNNKVNDVNGVEKYAGEVFNDFDDILSKDTQNQLYALADQYANSNEVNIPLVQYLKTNSKLLKDIQTDITNYFDTVTEKYKTLYFDKLPYISKSILVKAGVPKEKLLTRKQVEEAQEDPKNIQTVLKAFMYNDWIHRFEVSSLMFGDRAQWNHGKEEQPKRIPGAQSDGIGFLYDQSSRDFINDVFNKTTETYGAKLTRESEDNTKYDSFKYSDVLNTAVIKDAQRESIYLAEYQAAWKKNYIEVNNYSEEEADRLVELDSKPFRKDKMDESDGIAYMTLDAYRTLHKTGRGWSVAQEALYQKVVAGETISTQDAKEFFPIYKLHYYGSLKNDLLPAMAMHKFSVAPLIPGVYPETSELGKLHKKMLKDNVQYVTFKSGSKAVTLTNGGNVDNLFANSNENSINEDFTFTVNPIFMANLKEVTVINEYYKKTLPIATQTRVIILDNLYNDGKLTNSDNAPLVNDYKNVVRDYSIVLKDELLNKIGYSLNEDGNYEGDITTFVQVLREELGNRDIPEQLLKLLNTTKEGKLSIDLSLHPQAETIEKLLLSIIQTTLIKQQTNGEPLTQMPSTFTNGIWDDQYKTLTNPADIERLLGTNTLPFYNINKTTGKTNLMKVAIALQGEYKNLLKAKDLDGNVIGTIDRLNELIKDDKWLEQNRDAISLFGPRIPNDATNTIEGAEVWHFFNESFGNAIILPTEIVAKAGSDYDGDKLFMSMPNVDKDGNYINKGIDNYDALLKETIALEKDGKLGKDRLKSGQLIELQKKYLQNLYLKKSIDLLTLPDNFGYLTKPNQTYLVEKYAEDLQKLGTGYNRYESATHGSPKKSVGPKDKQKDVVSPTRQNEISHQLYLHDANLSLEPSLGVQANFTKSHVLYKTVGVNMPATYTTSYTNFSVNRVIKSLIELPMVMRLKHNTAINEAGKEVISLSGEKTQLGTRITDINSHALNGILDRAKNSFPFDLKLVPEAINTLNYMLQAGVSEEEIFYFLTQPLIVEYIKDQKLRKSPYYSIVYGESKGSKTTASANAIIQNMINVKGVDFTSYLADINLLKLKATLESYAASAKKSKEAYNVKLKDESILYTLTPEEIINKINNGDIDPTTIKKIFNSNAKDAFEEVTESKELFTDKNYAFTTQAFSNAFLPEGIINIDFLKKHIKDSSSPAALTLFFNYLELEQQYEGMSELEKVFSPDKIKLTTAQQVIKREEAYKNLYENSKVDKASLERLTKQSVLSSFNQDKLILDLVTPLFPLRLSNEISSYITKLFNDPTESRKIRNKFGTGIDGQEFFTKKYQNAIVAYIYQNYMSRFVNADGTLTNIPESYNGKPVLVNNDINTNVIIDKDSIIINSDRVRTEYQRKVYLSANKNVGYTGDKFAKDPFNTLNSYYRYTIEKELLRTSIPIESLEQNKDFLNLLNTYNTADEAYESYISEKALANTYNRSYIVGTAKYSYTEKVLNIIKEFENTNLKDKYPILAQLAPVKTKKAVKLIQLNDKQIAKGVLGEIYINNLINLANPIIKKVDDPIDNQRISDVFKDFSLMMFYQHGVGNSKLGFVNAIDPEVYTESMTKFSQQFLNNYLSDDSLTDVYNMLMAPGNLFGNFEIKDVENEKPYSKADQLTPFELPGSTSPVANIPQNKISGVASFGSTVTANDEVIKVLGANAHSIDMIESGLRTRTTRSESEMAKYAVKVGDIIKHFGKSADGSTKTILAKVTAIHPKGTPGFKGTWNKEGWRSEDVNVIDRFKDGAAAIEFEIINNNQTPGSTSVNKKVIKNEKGLIIINNAIPTEKTIDIVKNNKDFIQETSFKQTNGSVSWGYGMQWIRSSALTDKQKQGVQIGKQIGGQEVTEEMVNQLLAGTEAKKIKGMPLYVYTNIDINGNRLPNIPNEIIEILLEQGIDVSQYDASYNSVYDKNDKGSLIVHQDNTEFNTSPIITVSLGRPMKFITYQLKDSSNYSFGTNAKNRYELTLNTISNKLVAGKLAPELKRQKNFKGDEVIGYGELTPGNLAKYAKMVGEESAALDALANSIEKIEEHTLTNGAVLVFSKENRNVFHEIIFDEETDALPMPKGFPELTINKAYKGLGKPDQMVKTKDYRVVLTLRKVNGTKELDVVDTNKLTASQPTQVPTPIQPISDIDNSNKPVLNSLPNKSSIPTMTYAGIGSRQTPQEVLNKMTEVAKYLDGLGYTLQTGFTFKDKNTGLDEEGADKAFSDGAQNKILFGPSGIRKTINGETSVDTYNPNVTTKSTDVVKEVHPAPEKLSPGALKLMARNTNQIFGKNLDSTVDFVIFYAPETNNPLRPKGGTGQAVEMARRKGIPTINLANSNWREELKTALANRSTQSPTKVEVKAFRTSGTFSSTVDYAQRGSGTYYALDKPFQELGRTDKVEEVNVSYNPSKTLDATTEEGQSKFMEIKRKAVEGKTFDEIKDLNDAVSQEMMNNGYESLIGWIDEDVPNVGRELVIYPTQSSTDTNYQLPQNRELEEYVASEKTIRDLAARMSDRIGIPFIFESDRTKEYKGKLESDRQVLDADPEDGVTYGNVKNTAFINLAYATLDTPIHEILGHPIIRAIKNNTKGTFYEPKYDNSLNQWVIEEHKIDDYDVHFFNTKKEADAFYKSKQSQLYQNLLKELETGKGKEVLDRIKRDYNKKFERGKSFTFEGKDYIADNASKTGYRDKYGNDVESNELEISLFAYELKHKDKIYYTLEEQQEEALVELLGMMTAGKLDAVKDGNLISLLKRLLKEIKTFVKDLLKQKEIEINKLPDNMTLGDISDILAYSNSKLILPGNEVEYTTPDNQKFKTYQEASNHISQLVKNIKDVDLDNIKIENKGIPNHFQKDTYQGDRDYTDWYSFNDGKYYVERDGQNYEDGFSRTKEITKQEFEQAYIDSQNYGGMIGKGTIDSDITSFIAKNKEYEQSKEIIDEWKKINNIQYKPEEIYSRGQEFTSVVGAYSDFDVNLMMQNLLSHIEDNEKAGGKFAISAFTKPIDKKISHLEGGGGKIKFKIYPQSQDILWAANIDVYSGSVWDAADKVNKDKKSELLGVSYTKYPSLDNVNAVQPNLASIVDDLAHHHNELGISLTGNNFRLEYDDNIPNTTKKIIDSINSILDQKYGKIIKPEIKKQEQQIIKYGLFSKGANDILDEFNTKEEAQTAVDFNNKLLIDGGESADYSVVPIKNIGIQPTQTKNNIKEDIKDVREKIRKQYDETIFHKYSKDELEIVPFEDQKGYFIIQTKQKNANGYPLDDTINIFKSEDLAKAHIEKNYNELKTIKPKPDYTTQALINTKIAALKEIAKKYPRTLIRNEVKPINELKSFNQFEIDELPFQKLKSKSFINNNNISPIENDQEMFNQMVKQNNGQYPKRFENQGRVWLLNANNLYDSIDDVSKSIIIKNMNMVTGQIEPEIKTETPVNQEELFNFIQSINNSILNEGLDVILANNGINVQDILDEASKVTTQEELTDLENNLKKYICR
jgi:hypothetical protein